MEVFIYINGKFVDRVSNSIDEILKAHPRALVKEIKDVKDEICGPSKELYLIDVIVGDIYYTSFGYDETHYKFIKVVGFTKSGKSAICKRVYMENTGEGNAVYDEVKPTDKTFGQSFKLRIDKGPNYFTLRGSFPYSFDANPNHLMLSTFFKHVEGRKGYMETNPQFGH